MDETADACPICEGAFESGETACDDCGLCTTCAPPLVMFRDGDLCDDCVPRCGGCGEKDCPGAEVEGTCEEPEGKPLTKWQRFALYMFRRNPALRDEFFARREGRRG